MRRQVLQSHRLVLIIALVAGHALTLNTWHGVDATAGEKETRFAASSWKPLTVPHSETKDYGIYTYVLFGRQLNASQKLEAGTLERYERLLQAVDVSSLYFAADQEPDKRGRQLFMIPHMENTEALSRYKYNDAVSLYYLSFAMDMLKNVAPLLSERLATSEGPFLITVPLPLPEMKDRGAILLFADLSSANPQTIPSVVRAYGTIHEKGMPKVERIGSLRSVLLEIIPNPDNNLKVVATTRGDPVAVRQHLWNPLTDLNAEERGFGMYTYVLFSRRMKPMGRLKPETMAI